MNEEEQSWPKLLLTQNPYWCLEEECKKPGPFKNAMALATHISAHKMSKAEYAKKHKTCEWIVCKTCNKETFRSYRMQALRQGRFLCIDPECQSRAEEKLQQMKKLRLWYKENPKEAQKVYQKAANSRRAKGEYDFEIMSKRSKKGWQKSIESGTAQRGRIKARKTFFEHFGLYSILFPAFSLESQDLFMAIEENLLERLTCYYATKQNELFGTILENGHRTSGEFQVWHESNRFCRFLDFYIKELDVCIEFDEKRHENNEAKKQDLIRENDIKRRMPNIKILRVKKKDFLTNKDKILKECLDFIRQYAEHIPRFPQSIGRGAEQEAP